MAVPFFDLKDQYATLREELRAAVDRVLDSQVCIGGPDGKLTDNVPVESDQCRTKYTVKYL